ncbi:MAG TPA: Ser-Thr-rich GPI-anchored membrane family protein [Candidatus Hydrogenedentes bacterium]|nr:Ser-Thr-rich GPI-anchored membrane family protein [Candidatus Hydrogenedentota bacterium]HPG70147.1 Ser-Thr-rich GPI-anchored membrane family protein [Candidatus Hydrogenedentota bacterium]
MRNGRLLTAGLVAALAWAPWAVARIYVDKNAVGLNDGTSWPNAYTSLQAAVNDANTNGPDEIWVATAEYDEVRTEGAFGGPETYGSLILKSGAYLYGGFTSGMTDIAERNWVDNPTVIDGGGAVHVIAGYSSNAVLDGFMVTNGHALGTEGYHDSRGGGMFNWDASPTIANCYFTGNSARVAGGGIFNESGSSPTITDTLFEANIALGAAEGLRGGGAIFNNVNSNPTLTNVTFLENEAQTVDAVPALGGAIANYNSHPTVSRCWFQGNTAAGSGGAIAFQTAAGKTALDALNSVFYGNEADGDGGAVCCLTSSPSFLHCTFVENVADAEVNEFGAGGAVYVGTGSDPMIANSILWDNGPEEIYVDSTGGTVEYADVEGGWAGTGNINEPPQFVNATEGDFALQAGSLCIDAGGAVYCAVEDFDGQPRPVGAGCDMGAYEYQASEPDIAVTTPNGGEAWTMDGVYTIEWTSNVGLAGAEVRIGLHYGATFVDWIVRRTDNDGQYWWKIPTDLAPGDVYFIRVQSYTDSGIRDLSDAPFSLSVAPLVVTSPEYQDDLTIGTNVEITWQSNDPAVGDHVRLGLHKGGAFLNWLIRRTANDGSWNWIVPAELTPGLGYRLRLQSYDDKNLRTMSSAFTISAAK